MAETTIEWADYTFNPWIGCVKVSPACQFCYAERDFDKRFGKAKWGANGTRVLTSDANWNLPIKWNRFATDPVASAMRKDFPRRPRVFCASLADVFEDWDGPIWDHRGLIGHVYNDGGDWGFGPHMHAKDVASWNVSNARLLTMRDVRNRLFTLIDATPNLDWLVLTKRPENILRMTPAVNIGSQQQAEDRNERGELYRRNVWLGTSVENQEYADKRIPELLKCRDLSPVLFLSCEPLLGPVELCYPPSIYPDGPQMCCSGFECGCNGLPCDPPAYLNGNFGGVGWVITGGESGPDARPMHPDWSRSLRDQCKSANVPFLFKQWGEWLPFSQAGTKELHEACSKATVEGNQTFFGAQVVSGSQGLKWGGTHGISPVGIHRVGKSVAGRVLDGVVHNGFPKTECS